MQMATIQPTINVSMKQKNDVNENSDRKYPLKQLLILWVLLVGVLVVICPKTVLPQMQHPGPETSTITFVDTTGLNALGYVKGHNKLEQSQTLFLPAGWSGFSSYLLPENLSFSDILKSLGSELVMLKSLNGVYWPAKGVNSLGQWDAAIGYRVLMNEPLYLTITGEPVTDKVLALDCGWNLIPFLVDGPLVTVNLMAQLGQKLDIVMDAGGEGFYRPAQNMNTMPQMLPGRSYFVKMNNNALLDFDNYNPPPLTTTVTFVFKDAAMDTRLCNGTSTLYYRKGDWAQDSIVTTETGYIYVEMLVGETYEIDGRHSDDIEGEYGMPFSYTALKKPGDLEAFEQRAREFDQSSPVTISGENNTIIVYKLNKNFPLGWMQEYASKLNGLNEGIRKFDITDKDAPFWVDTHDGGLNLTAEQMEWYSDIVTDLSSVPHSYLTLPLQQGPTQPTEAHVRVSIDEDNPLTPSNSTSFNPETHEITQARASYPLSFSEGHFKVEIIQAIGDLNDVGGTPNIFNGPDQNYTLNTTGRNIFAVMYLFQPGTKF